LAEVAVSLTPLISIVDDDELVRDATAALVRSLGYEARTYSSAEAFLGSPGVDASDCLIVDVQMPGMSGLELQQALLRRPKPTPILFITAFPDADVRERVLAAGALNMLGKPCDHKVLVASIKAALAPP
jgi:FixJ family two-component response regulator